MARFLTTTSYYLNNSIIQTRYGFGLQCSYECQESEYDTSKVWDNEDVILFWLLGPAVNNPDET